MILRDIVHHQIDIDLTSHLRGHLTLSTRDLVIQSLVFIELISN